MYEQLITCLEGKGIVSFFQKPKQLVVAANFPHFPSSNSFWVAAFQSRWYLGTWLPRVYRVPQEQSICDVCTAVLRSSKSAVYHVSQNLISQFKLEELSEENTDLLIEELFGAPGQENGGC